MVNTNLQYVLVVMVMVSLCLQVISKDLFQTAFNRVARGMLHQDRIGFAVLLSRIELKQNASPSQLYETEFNHFLRAQVRPPKLCTVSCYCCEVMSVLSNYHICHSVEFIITCITRRISWAEEG